MISRPRRKQGLKQFKLRVYHGLLSRLRKQAREHNMSVNGLINLLVDDRIVVAVSRDRFHHYMDCNNMTKRQLKIKDGY